MGSTPQPKGKDWLNGYKNKTPLYAAYKRPTSKQGTHTDWKWRAGKRYTTQIETKRKQEWPSLSLFTAFVLKSILSDMSIATPAFFWSLFAWYIFFQPFIFSLYVSLVLRWVSCKQHIEGSCFCIHWASLCLLVGAFNPFTFKVIIDKYDPVTIYFIVLGSGLYTLFVFPVLQFNLWFLCIF